MNGATFHRTLSLATQTEAQVRARQSMSRCVRRALSVGSQVLLLSTQLDHPADKQRVQACEWQQLAAAKPRRSLQDPLGELSPEPAALHVPPGRRPAGESERRAQGYGPSRRRAGEESVVRDRDRDRDRRAGRTIRNTRTED